MKGDEESILEDLFHYAFYSESKILIKFDINKWKKKDIFRFEYLFTFFLHNEKLINLSKLIYFGAKKGETQLIKKKLSIVMSV